MYMDMSMRIGHGVAGQPPHVVPLQHHVPNKESNMQTSKAFRCTLPMLREDQVANLRRWADLHCAQSIAFRDDRGSAVFVGLKAELLRRLEQAEEADLLGSGSDDGDDEEPEDTVVE